MTSPKPPAPPRTPVSREQLEQHLRDQIGFLDRSCKSYDAGDVAEYKRMAVAIRILVHESRASKSLLGQLGLTNDPILSFAEPIDGRNLLPDWPLGLIEMSGGGGRYRPILDQGPVPPRPLPLDQWGHEIVYRDPDKYSIDRATIVLVAANQDGGAHVDPEIDDRYSALASDGGGMMMFGPMGEVTLSDLEKVCIRHIAFELTTSLRAIL